ESEHDHFTTGHSSNSLSLGLGLARGRDLLGQDYKVISIIGDGAFTGGQAYEALCDMGANKEKMLVILNDNEMSISKNVGAFSQHLAKLRLSKNYTSVKYNVKRAISGLPIFGERLVKLLDKTKDNLKTSLIANKVFENLGVKYYGPINGHDLDGLIEMLSRLKDFNGPAILHTVTKKGNGVDYVSAQPSKFHGVSPQHGNENSIPYASIVREKLPQIASKDEKIVAITAAMSSGTGLDKFQKEFPKRYFDVGIAEQHAVSMCSGLAKAGLKPYFAVYSSFLQRAFDQVVEDIGIDNHNVTILIDHAGAVTGDGVTHQGLYDLALLYLLPNITIMQPKDGIELENMLDYSLEFNGPLAIRYGKSFDKTYDAHKPVDLSWEVIESGNGEVVILATGDKMLDLAKSVDGATVISARVIKPLDETVLDKISTAKLIVTLEDGVVNGGFGNAVKNYYDQKNIKANVLCLGYPDRYLREYNEENMLLNSGLTSEIIAEKIKTHL
ncbi:MAG: 1-deoxy-D-xylulose-5-phosphate synthase, partial [Clostridia bacterium]|nr:1-deoxy-D-xylulose-5-phosphate synthase [Clostridia bacterium]